MRLNSSKLNCHDYIQAFLIWYSQLMFIVHSLFNLLNVLLRSKHILENAIKIFYRLRTELLPWIYLVL